jgi:hypothetical protein
MKKFSGTKFSDRKWITIICLLLAVEIIWLLSDLHLISLPFRSSSKSSVGAVEAGHIIRSQEDVKKRGSDSLIWEPAKKDDVLYYHDSVLTLGQSTATLYLKDQTELQMAENTLVTFEEPEAQSNAEIRLRFARGDVKARNPYAASKIESADWVVHLEKGAELAMRKEQSGYEFEVLAGHATLNTDNGKEDLIESKIIKLNDDKKIETIDKSLNLKWAQPETERIYTFGETATVPIAWTGKAEKLQVIKPGVEKSVERTENVKAQQESTELKLAPGNYQLRLADQGGISSPKTVEVLKAPKIYLKKPLPRDRIQIGTPLEFVWESEKALKSYNLKLSNGQNFDVTDNFKVLNFDKEQDIVWSIEAHDADGFRVPAMYQSTVYLRHDTLAAPKLLKPKMVDEVDVGGGVDSTSGGADASAAPAKATKLKKSSPGPSQKPPKVKNKKSPPTSKLPSSRSCPLVRSNNSEFTKKVVAAVKEMLGQWLQKKNMYFQSTAEAQILRKKNVIFEWEPVEGANQYIIEISSDPEFKSPEVVETLNTTKYVWKKYDPKKKYFWRVASGNSNGRMGLFSDATPLEVVVETKSHAAEAEAASAKAAVKETEAAKREAEEADRKAKQNAEEATKAWTPQSEGPQYATQAKWSIAYAPGFKIANLPGEQNIKIDLSGAVPLAADFQYRSSEINERFYFVDFYVSPQTWKSKTEVAGVTQPDLKYNEVFLSLRTADKNSDMQYGLAAHTDFYGRVTGASIGTESLTFLGAEVAKLMTPQVTLEGAFMISGSFGEIKLAACYKSYFSNSDENAETKYFYGANLISTLQSGTFGSGHQTQVQFLIGISGF